MSPELKKRLALAAGLVAVALASIPVLDSFSGKNSDTTPGSVPVSSGRIVNKEAASAAATEPTLVIAQLPESSAPAAASTPAQASPSPATPDLGKTPAANLAHSSPARATPAPPDSTPAPASKLPPLSDSPAANSAPPAAAAAAPKARAPVAPPPPPLPATQPATQPATPAAKPASTTGHAGKTVTPPPAPTRQSKAANTEIDLPPASPPAAPPAVPALGNKAAPNGSSLGYQVQLGLFASPDNADKLIDELKKRGITARTETRVQLGPFATRAEAEEAMAKLKALGYQPMLVPAGSR